MRSAAFCGASSNQHKLVISAVISVILPTYNREALLHRSIQSILNQTYKQFELIVVDDASTDETSKIISKIHDPRLRYVKQPVNQGACAARNRGIKESKGDYIAFQDSDDVWLANKLETQIRYLERMQSDIVFCAFLRYGTGGNPIGIFPGKSVQPGLISYQQLLKGNLISTQTMLGKKECFDQYLFDESMPRLQDWELVLRLSRNYKITYDDNVLAHVFVQEDSLSKDPRKGLNALARIYEHHNEVIDRHPDLKRQFVLIKADILRDSSDKPWQPYLNSMTSQLDMMTNLILLAYAAKRYIVRKKS